MILVSLLKSLAHNKKKFEDEDLTVIFLNSLPKFYTDVRNAIKYSRDKLTQVIVINALRYRELQVKKESKPNFGEKSMFVRGRIEKRENNIQNRKSKGK